MYLKDHINTINRGKKKIQYKPQKKHVYGELKCGMCNIIFYGNSMTFMNLHFSEMHMSTLFEQLGIKYNHNTEDGFEREEIGRIIMESSTSISPDKIQCQICMKESDTKIRLLGHIKNHFGFRHKKERKSDGQLENSCMCPTCGKVLSILNISQHKICCGQT